MRLLIDVLSMNTQLNVATSYDGSGVIRDDECIMYHRSRTHSNISLVKYFGQFLNLRILRLLCTTRLLARVEVSSFHNITGNDSEKQL